MAKSGTEKVYHPRGPVRYNRDSALSAGAGTLTFDPVPVGYELRVSMIAVAATDVTAQPPGMVVAAYIDSADIPEALVGWDQIVGPAPGIVLDSPGEPLVVRSGERLVVRITNAGDATTVRGRVSGDLMETEDQPWPRAEPVQIASWADPQMTEPTVWADQPAEG